MFCAPGAVGGLALLCTLVASSATRVTTPEPAGEVLQCSDETVVSPMLKSLVARAAVDDLLNNIINCIEKLIKRTLNSVNSLVKDVLNCISRGPADFFKCLRNADTPQKVVDIVNAVIDSVKCVL